jgi:hypothetical protein
MGGEAGARGAVRTRLIIGFARYWVKPRSSQLTQPPLRHSSKIWISKKRIFYFWRTHPQRNRQDCRKLKELHRILVWPRDCFPHTRDRTNVPAPQFRPRSGSSSTHVWCGSPAGEKAPEHTVALFGGRDRPFDPDSSESRSTQRTECRSHGGAASPPSRGSGSPETQMTRRILASPAC